MRSTELAAVRQTTTTATAAHLSQLAQRSAAILLAACLGMASPATAPAVEASPEMAETLEEFRQLEELTRLVQREYVRPVTREDLWAGAYSGMLTQLDPHSRYLSKRELVMNQQSGSDHVGFGFDWRFDQRRERYMVARVVAGGPAARAGVVRGTVIQAIDEVPITNLGVHDVRQLMLKLDDQVSMSLQYADLSTATVSMQREHLSDHGVGDAELLDSRWGIGLIAVQRMIAGTDDDNSGSERSQRTATARHFRMAVDDLARQGLRALIIDVRGNAGGSLTAGVEIADAFLDGGPGDGTLIVSQQSRHGDHQALFRATSVDTYPRWPIVVLIDQQTASSAEIVAAALRDHRRALLMGEPSAGKNSVQRMFLLDTGSAVSLTVASYRTPAGDDLADQGITPDVMIATDPTVLLEQARYRNGQREDQVTDPAIERAREVLKGMLLHQSGLGL